MLTLLNHIRAFLLSLAMITHHYINREGNFSAPSNGSVSVEQSVSRSKMYRYFVKKADNGVDEKNEHAFIYILGLFELSTRGGAKRVEGYAEMEAAQLAIKHINARDFIPGHKLEMLVNDSQCDPGAGIDRYFHALYSGKTIMMLLGTACSNVTESLASIVPYWNILQISFGSKSPVLSDRTKFPLFFRTITPDTSHNQAKLAFVRHFKWNAIAMFTQRENTYLLPSNSLMALLEENNIYCISVTFAADNYQEQLKLLKDSDVRIVFASFSPQLSPFVFCELYRLKMYGADYVWILQDLAIDLSASSCKSHQLLTSLEGTIFVSHYDLIPPGQASISQMSQSDLEILTNPRNSSKFSKYSYDAVWTMALVLKSLQTKHNLNVSDFYYDSDEFITKMTEELKSLKFVGASGPMSFHGADRLGNSILRQIQKGSQKTIAIYNYTVRDKAKSLNFKCKGCDAVTWQGNAIPIAKRIYTLRLVTIPRAAFFLVLAYSSMGIIVCLLFFYFNFHYKRIKVVKLSSPRLNNTAVFGCVLVFVAVILLGVDSATMRVNYFSQLCMFRVFLLSAGISLAFGSVFAKTYRVHRIFTCNLPAGKDRFLKDMQLIILVLVLVSIDGAIVTFWTVLDPLERHLLNLTMEINSKDRSVLYQPQVEVCRSRNTTGWFVAMYGYKGFLLIMGVYMAWETRHIKVEALKDSQHIGICVYSAVFSSILVLLSNLLTDYNALLAFLTRTLSILATTTLTLLLLFVPKLKAVFWDDQQDPIMPGLKIESNTRRLEIDDPNELTYRLLVQNKVYRCELEALDKQIAHLEGLLFLSQEPPTRARSRGASWPCSHVLATATHATATTRNNSLSQGALSPTHEEDEVETEGRFFNRMRELLGRLYRPRASQGSDVCHEATSIQVLQSPRADRVEQMHRSQASGAQSFYMDVEEHI